MLMLQDNFSLSLCDTKLIILVAYSPLTEVKTRKFYIQLCSLLANGAGNLSKDSKNWSIFILCSYAKLHRYFSSLFLPCMSFANPVIFRTNSPYSPAWVVPHSTSIMCRGNQALYSYYWNFAIYPWGLDEHPQSYSNQHMGHWRPSLAQSRVSIWKWNMTLNREPRSRRILVSIVLSLSLVFN